MLRSLIRNIAACAALLAVGLPAVAGAQTAGATATDYHFSTTITPVYGSPYPVAGHLDLEIFPSGIVRGYYHNAYQKAFVPVTGGRDGDYLWFDIGPTLVDLGLGVAPGGRL
ncbi:MAG TPA: hypothetical protein VNG31_08965, partial [Candidatus Baltobacteraceae bacterium]|nr:hypothetical protein [Candidatus Baltobacteraceae bacterium]